MRIGVDVGGTFTDFVLFDEQHGALQTFKLLSTPRDPAEAVLEGLEGIEPGAQVEVVHGSTVATNAVLERQGARTAFVTTDGFRDLLQIGRQTRRELYDLFAERPEPLVPRELCFEVKERVDAGGRVLEPLDAGALPALARELEGAGVESVALCLLFSFLHPEHERELAEGLRQRGLNVSASHEVLPEFREYERASTTAMNAYVGPILDRYLGRLERALWDSGFFIMQSNGGVVRADWARARAVNAILSGPAGGAVGARHVARAAGFQRVISFDMGGTSTDVSLCDGEVSLTVEAEIDGLPVRVPVIDIHTVGSGGGSIARVDPGGALRVGPGSAGADPGPACYGRGGAEPTVTDANLVLGRLAAEHFLGGRMALKPDLAQGALAGLGSSLGLDSEGGLSATQKAALGVVQVVNAHMERALRVISVARGHDPRDFTLVSFGGAGGLHAADLARGLGIPRLLVPPTASTLSAFGMLAADVVHDEVQTVMLPGDTDLEALLGASRSLEVKAREALAAQGFEGEQVQLQRELDLRYRGQAYELRVPLGEGSVAAFHRLHEQVYGHSAPGAPVEIVNLRLRAVAGVPRPGLGRRKRGGRDPSAASLGRRPVVLADGHVAPVPFYRGERLQAGNEIPGPAVVVFKDTTLVLGLQDRGSVDGLGNVVVEVGGV
jgi:N-methylhydantoinase A